LIEGVMETTTIPLTPIKNYRKQWLNQKSFFCSITIG
jgi:hypothetical protein